MFEGVVAKRGLWSWALFVVTTQGALFMSELRQRMIYDMRIRNDSPGTIEVGTSHHQVRTYDKLQLKKNSKIPLSRDDVLKLG